MAWGHAITMGCEREAVRVRSHAFIVARSADQRTCHRGGAFATEMNG